MLHLTEAGPLYTLTLKPLNTSVSCQLNLNQCWLKLPLQLLSLSLFAMNLHQQFCLRERRGNGWPRSNINEKVSFFHPVLMPSLACMRGNVSARHERGERRVVAGRCRPMFLLQCLCFETGVADRDRFIILSLSPMKPPLTSPCTRLAHQFLSSPLCHNPWHEPCAVINGLCKLHSTLTDLQERSRCGACTLAVSQSTEKG